MAKFFVYAECDEDNCEPIWAIVLASSFMDAFGILADEILKSQEITNMTGVDLLYCNVDSLETLIPRFGNVRMLPVNNDDCWFELVVRLS